MSAPVEEKPPSERPKNEQSRARRSPHIRFLVGLGAALLVWRLLPPVPEEQTVVLSLGSASSQLQSIAVRWRSEEHQTTGGFELHYAHGAPKRVSHRMRVSEGEYVFAVRATDTVGKKTSTQRRVTLRGTPVTLRLESLLH